MGKPLSETPLPATVSGTEVPPIRGVRSTLARGMIGGLLIAGAAVLCVWSYFHSQASFHWQAAERALELQDAEAACDHLEHCLLWWNGRYDVRFQAARAARLAGRLDQAEEHLTYCERLAGSAPEERLLRERSLLQVQQGDLAGHLERLAPQGPSDPTLSVEVLEALAHGFGESLYDVSALVCLDRLFGLEPAHVRGRLLAGEIYTRLTFHEQAEQQFEKAVAQAPRALGPRQHLAVALLDVGKVREAAVQIDVLLSLFPEHPEGLYARARQFVYRGRVEDAKADLDRVLTNYPGHVPALLERGRLEYRHGDPRKSLKWFGEATQIQPGSLEAWQGLAKAHDVLKNVAEAKKCWDTVEDLKRRLGEMSRLDVQINQLKSRGTAMPLALAEICEQVHLPAKAASWRWQALHAEPQNRAARLAQAQYFEAIGQPHRAARQRVVAGPP